MGQTFTCHLPETFIVGTGSSLEVEWNTYWALPVDNPGYVYLYREDGRQIGYKAVHGGEIEALHGLVSPYACRLKYGHCQLFLFVHQQREAIPSQVVQHYRLVR